MIEMLLLLAVLLGAGMWTKHTNTLYMRKLNSEWRWQNRHDEQAHRLDNKIGPANKYLR